MRESDLWPALRGYWHPVAFSEEAGGKPLAVQLLDERLVLCRLGGQVRAFHDLCIHRGTPISLGWVEGETIVCAYHGWAYQADGACVRIPSIPPEHPIPKKACLTAYRAQERYGLIWVCLEDEPRASIPECPEFDDPGFRMFLRQRKLWRGSAARVIENFVDQAHFAWVHEGILGDRDQSLALAPEMHLKREGEELRFWFENESDRFHSVPHRRNYRLKRPFTIHQRKEQPDDQTEVYFVVSTPHSAKESTRFMLLARNYNLDAPDAADGPILVKGEEITAPSLDESAQRHVDTQEKIFEQDRVVVEKQRPEELPLDLSEEMHLKGPDAVAVEYRKMLKEIGVE